MTETLAPAVTLPDQALAILMQGNMRFCSGRTTHPNQSAARRAELVRGQKPWAFVWGCMDSRVPPEIIFDCGLGDLYIVRTAGQVPDNASLASLEFAIESGVKLLVLLGHQDCEAVRATVEAVDKSKYREGHINTLLKAIKPAVEKTRSEVGDWGDNAVRENISMETTQLLTTSETLKKAVAQGRVVLVGARYSIVTGQVEIVTRVPPV